MGVLFALLLFFISPIQASKIDFVLSSDGLIDPRAIEKINQIGSEVQTKTGTKIYVFAKNNYNISNNLTMEEKLKMTKEYESNILKTLSGSYVLLSISVEQTHVNLFTSPDLKETIDKNEVLNDYVIPLLASKDKNQIYAKVSAALFNGYAQIADEVAQSKNITLETGIESSGKTFGTIWKVFMYFVIVTGIAAYTVAVLRAKKK